MLFFGSIPDTTTRNVSQIPNTSWILRWVIFVLSVRHGVKSHCISTVFMEERERYRHQDDRLVLTVKSSFFYPYPTKWGRYNMFTFMLWWRLGNYFYDLLPAEHQPSLKLEWLLTTANAAGTKSLTCLAKHGAARDNKFWSSGDRPLWMLLTFHVRMPSTLTAGLSSSLVLSNIPNQICDL
jgi:hypothetical protein